MQVGSYKAATIANHQDDTITFHTRNVAGEKAFFFHMLPNSPNQTGAMHNMEQIFEWNEHINRKRLLQN